MNPIRVVVADDQIFAIDGLHSIVSGAEDMQVVGRASTILEVLDIVEKTQPDAVVLDIAWPGDREAGIKAIPLIRETSPHTQVVAVTVYPELVGPAHAAGAYSLEKSFTRVQLLDTIRWAVQNAGAPLTRVAEREMQRLTDRERDILRGIVQGSTDKQIAGQLNIAEGTVKKHVGNILSKLGAASRTEAAVVAERHRLL